MYSERKMSEGGWRVRRMTCAPRVASSRTTSAPIPDVPPWFFSISLGYLCGMGGCGLL